MQTDTVRAQHSFRLTQTTPRVDLDGSWSGVSPMSEYSEREARAALERMEATHRRNGW